MINFIEVNNDRILFWLSKTENMDLSGTEVCRYKGFSETDNYEKIRDHSLSIDYLNMRLRNVSDSKIEYAYNKLIGETEGGSYLLKNLKTILNYSEFYTSGCDPKGFVGWHSDSDITGYYISFVFQGDSEGILKYRDPETEQVVDFVNSPGWNVFAYKLGCKKQDTLWHASVSESKRFSFLIKFSTEEELEKAIQIIASKV